MNILTTNSTGNCLFTFVREGTMYEISTVCFIYRSIFAISELRKRCVHVHCAAYHFRIFFLACFVLLYIYYQLKKGGTLGKVRFQAKVTGYYKDRKCAVNENPCSAQIVPVKLSTSIIVLWPFR